MKGENRVCVQHVATDVRVDQYIHNARLRSVAIEGIFDVLTSGTVFHAEVVTWVWCLCAPESRVRNSTPYRVEEC